MTLPYTEQDIKKEVSRTFFSRGQSYFKQGLVHNVHYYPEDFLLEGEVQGSDFDPYEVAVEFYPHKGAPTEFDGECSCPVGYNCKHVVAVLLAALATQNGRQQKQNILPFFTPAENTVSENIFLTDWLERVDTALSSGEEKDAYPSTVKQRMLYLLDLQNSRKGTELIVVPASGNIRKDGTFGAWKSYDPHNANKPSPAKFLKENDLSLLRRLTALTSYSYSYLRDYVLSGRDGKQLLLDMLATGRCYWKEPKGSPLFQGKDRPGQISWNTLEDGSQQVVCQVEPEATMVFPLSPPFYLDTANNSCGIVQIDNVPLGAAGIMLQAPPIQPDEVEKIHEKLKSRLPQSKEILPHRFEKIETRKVTPVPHLHLFNATLQAAGYRRRSWMNDFSEETEVPVAKLSFLYENNKIVYFDETPKFSKMENGKLVSLKRDESFEKATLKRLIKKQFVPIQELNSMYSIPEESQASFIMGDKKGRIKDEESLVHNWMKFSLETVPELRKKGWQIEIDPDFIFNMVKPDDEWYSEIDDSSGIDWFEMELGVTLNGQKLNLLPVFLSCLKNNPYIFDELEQLPEGGSFFCPMPNGSKLVLPIGRVKTLLSFLKDLYNFENLGENGKLKLSRLESADLVEFEAAMKAVSLRWFGGERVRQLGQQLKNFSGITPVEPPRNFQAQLRHYQQDGLNWLQFLREYQLAGILADDMGLGKTVQTLAHVAVEKENKRLDKPVLVISPTSVLPNWRSEAERFTPDLKILTLHGADRKDHYDKIKENDVVLTTYPLLTRDKDELLKETYHTIVLDEAQYIKNPKAKMNQVVCQLQADHRLCLTGTPMENHLGELWSLFNFLMPGLLGDEKQFRQFYRKPIEKEQNDDRRNALVRRIKPFMIRRTKDLVAAELPPKTEIVQNSELEKAQRDLYETIRVSMHEKVRKEIANKGLARSHIIVLDALLKLRQVCCDPRLLKIEAAQKVKHSVKLGQLMEMLTELLEEGRKILLFSQFVSMLKLIEEELIKKKIDYVKLTGQTKDRKTPIDQFQKGKVPLFLISLKAGGTGLNLTAADTVIHYDPWWNPAVENQATDRAHRIGQDKPVFVYKLITTGTVEEKILQLQEKKKALAEGIFDPQSKAAKKLTVEDINALFEPIG